MDEYLSEKEQIDEIRQWFRENGLFLFGGAAIVLAGYVGFNQYNAWQDRVGEQAAGLYFELEQLIADDDREGADSRLAELASGFADSPYLDQGRLLMAEANVVRDPQRSITELSAVVDRGGDEGLVNIARLRLARVLAYQEQYDQALAVLNIPEPGAFAARFSEVRGDIHAARGNREAAASAYTEALLGVGNGSVNTEFVQLKLNDVFDTGVPADETAAPAAASLETETAPEAAAAEPAASPQAGSPEPASAPPGSPE